MIISDSVQISIITATSATLAVSVPALLLYLTKRLEANHAEVKAQIEVVRQDVNGKMEKLIKVSGEAEKAKGVLIGQEQEKAKHGDDLPPAITRQEKE